MICSNNLEILSANIEYFSPKTFFVQYILRYRDTPVRMTKYIHIVKDKLLVFLKRLVASVVPHDKSCEIKSMMNLQYILLF